MKRIFLALIVVGFLVVAGWRLFNLQSRLVYVSSETALYQPAALSFQETITPRDLISRYRRGELKVLIVPGHDNQYSGSAHRGTREADMNLVMARYLAEALANDSKLEVTVSRDLLTGFYHRDIVASLDQDRQSILDFKSTKKSLMAELLTDGVIEERSTNNHTFAKDEVAYRLYGINKWANDNDIDLVIHIHFNDHPGHKANLPGKYQGFSIYVPDDQYPNGKAGLAIGEALFKTISTVRPVSTHPLELAGVVPDQELIAIGANASTNAAAVLIEYGYIYEQDFVDPVKREAMFKLLAEKTYKGLVAYLE